MSTVYELYTEVRINEKWYCINSFIKNYENDAYEMVKTYCNCSRTYFEKAYYELCHIGRKGEYQQLSEGLQKELEEFKDDDLHITIVPYSKLKSCIPKDNIKEFHGYVSKDDIAQYELGELDDIYEPIDIEEINKMTPEEKQLYQYYEWNDTTGWYQKFITIRDRVKMQLSDWDDVNGWKDYEDVRLVMFIDC